MLETRPDVDAVFLVHAGFEGTANLNDIWMGKLIGRTIRLCFWRVLNVEIPPTAEGRVEWLDAQWERVDAWVAAHAGSPLTDAAAEQASQAADRQSGRALRAEKT